MSYTACLCSCGIGTLHLIPCICAYCGLFSTYLPDGIYGA
ncbi:hypothetical protein V6Z11_D12G246300 [Gossypium hirsutum]